MSRSCTAWIEIITLNSTEPSGSVRRKGCCHCAAAFFLCPDSPPGRSSRAATLEPWPIPFFHRQQKFDFFRDGIWDRKLREVEPDAAFPRRRSKARFDIGPINHTYEKRRYVLQTLARCFAGCVHNISMLKLFKKWYSCSD